MPDIDGFLVGGAARLLRAASTGGHLAAPRLATSPSQASWGDALRPLEALRARDGPAGPPRAQWEPVLRPLTGRGRRFRDVHHPGASLKPEFAQIVAACAASAK